MYFFYGSSVVTWLKITVLRSVEFLPNSSANQSELGYQSKVVPTKPRDLEEPFCQSTAEMVRHTCTAPPGIDLDTANKCV